MNQKEKILNELLTDPRFRSWVMKGDHIEHWTKWQKNHPNHKQTLEDAKAIVKGLPVRTEEVLSSDIERSFREIAQSAEISGHQKRTVIVHWLSYAAAAVLALLVAFWLWNPSAKQDSQATMVVRTAPGEQQNIVLSDSSVVVLNGNSSLEYNENQDSRTVMLEGEAHFHVRRIEGPNGRKPFTVSTDDMNVTVLGTTFSVGMDSIWTTVVLEEGKVRLEEMVSKHMTGKTLIMKPDEKVVFNRKEESFSVEHINAVEFNSWTHNELSLVNRSAAEVARWMKRNYNISIDIPDEYRRSSLTGSVSLEDPTVAVQIFALALGLKPLKEGKKEWEFKKPNEN